MIPIPIPSGLELPEGEPVEISATVQMVDGELMLLELNGMPFEEEMPEDEMEEEEMSDEDFMSAVERGIQGQ
jgi:hypothetical protein